MKRAAESGRARSDSSRQESTSCSNTCKRDASCEGLPHATHSAASVSAVNDPKHYSKYSIQKALSVNATKGKTNVQMPQGRALKGYHFQGGMWISSSALRPPQEVHLPSVLYTFPHLLIVHTQYTQDYSIYLTSFHNDTGCGYGEMQVN